MVQEFLNRSDEHVWAFLSNGRQLRILRDNVSLSRQAFVEFDLESMMEGEVYADFALLWLLCHQSRVESDKAVDCWLEKWSKLARDQGTRVLNELRVGVQKAIEALGRGFIGHPRNDHLREKFRTGSLTTDEFYRQLLRIVYRVLFLFVAEDRKLLHPPDANAEACNLYDTHYSTRRLRELAQKIRGSKHADLWHSLSLIFDALSKNDGCPELGLCGLGSFLWRSSSTADLLGPGQQAEEQERDGYADPVLITNDDLLQAVRALAYVEQDKVLRNVDYRNLGSEELGSVYESLLELHPVMNAEAKAFELSTATGNERKTTGSYYTPDSLVQCLLDSALDPVVVERLKKKKGAEAEQAILHMKVCDPACGSGHFLIAAAHRLARQLARVRTGETEPSPDDYQHALRDIIGRCVYGVDINPMAVELCKVSLWMEAIEPGKPLSFLDHHVQCGNSLLGTTPALLAKGIPDDAFNPIEGDDKDVAKRLKKRNRDERQGQTTFFGLFATESGADYNAVATQATGVEQAADDNISAVREKELRWDRLSCSAEFKDAWFRADAWCSAFVWPKQPGDPENTAITYDIWRRIEKDVSAAGQVTRKIVREKAQEYRFFHWHLAFPQVFGDVKADFEAGDTTGWTSGFDVVLGNPPWERVKLQEKEFFAARAPEIAEARNAAARKKAIARVEDEEPALWSEWQAALREADGATHAVRDNGRYPLCGRGDVNTYSIFAELKRTVIASTGRVGAILPSGLATDSTTQFFFRDLIESGCLASFYEFENEGFFTAGKGHMLRFALTTLTGSSARVEESDFVFQAHAISDLLNPERHFTLSPEDIELINPNTRTCPIFRCRRDAEITKHIYRRVPVLVREATEFSPDNNPWGVSFLRMLDMANDSGLFHTREELETQGWRLRGNVFEQAGERMLPLYEAKMASLFNHRHGEFAETPPGKRPHRLPPMLAEKLRNPTHASIPYYWVLENEVNARLQDRWNRGWLLGWRDVADARASVRTVVAAVIPQSAVNHKLLLMLPRHAAAVGLIACLMSLPLDFVARQKLGGLSLSYFIMKQLPLLPPTCFEGVCPWSTSESVGGWVRPRLLELLYTAWDLEPFAQDCSFFGPPFQWDDERRFLLQRELDAGFFPPLWYSVYRY